MTEKIGALRLRMVEPLDVDEAARTLARAGLLVSLTDWSARERRFDLHPWWLGILSGRKRSFWLTLDGRSVGEMEWRA